MLNAPPWTGSLFPVQSSQLNTLLFTVTEVEKVVKDLPNNKASGLDGVTYETLKTTKQMVCPIYLTPVWRMVKFQNHGKGP